MTERPATSSSQVALWLLLAAGLGLGLWQRATPLAGAFLFGDELHSLGALHLPWSVLLGRYDAVGSGLALPLVQKALVGGLGASLPVIRAVAFVPALLLVAAVAWLAHREGGRAAAIVAALLVALAPVFVFYGHFARSYSLAALLCVGVQIACDGGGAQDSERAEPGSLAWPRALGIALMGGLAVYAHLVSVFFLVGLGIGVFAASTLRGGLRGLAVHPATAGLALAALLALLLHAPALDSLLAFVGQKGDQVYRAGFGPLDVVAVLAGSSPGTVLVAAGVALSAVVELRERHAAAAPIVCATLLPPALLWLVSPYGDAYAYARYLLPSAAAGSVLLALGAVRLGRWLAVRVPALPVEVPGVLLAMALFAFGPRGPLAAPLGPFANTYLGLYPLPAFTEGVPPAPGWYDDVAGQEPCMTLVEVPPLRNRAVHYMAALWRWHGQDVRMGTFGPIVPGAPPLDSRLYVDLTRIADAPRDFDALVVHRRVVDEVERYWTSVYSSPTARGPGRALLDRHRVYGHDLPSVARGVTDKLESVLGAPTHEDVDIVVWRFTEGDASAR